MHQPIELRRLGVDDAAALSEAVEHSVEHLRPWMPWAAHEPLTAARRLELLRGWERAWDEGSAHHYGIFAEPALAGVCGLHDRIGAAAREIGYWVRPDRTGRGYATTAARGLIDVAAALPGVRAVEIHHDVANEMSARIPRRLGFRDLGTRPDDVQAPGETGVSRIWRFGLFDEPGTHVAG